MSTVAVAAATQPATTPPRVKVDITDSGSPAITAVTVVRRDAAGVTTAVRTPDGGPLQLVTSGSTRVASVFDYEVPFGVPVTYSTVEFPAGTSTAVTLDVSVPWLVPPGFPSRGRPITIAELPERSRQVNRGVFHPMGRANPVVVTDGRRYGAEGKLRVFTRTDAERAAMDVLLDDASVLFFNVPASKGWGVPSCYLSIGDVNEQRLSRLLVHPDRMWDLPYVVVDRPAGGQVATYTWADVMAKYSTWQALIDANATWAAVQNPTT